MRRSFHYSHLFQLLLLTQGSYYWVLNAFKSSSGSIGDLVAGIDTLKGAAKDLSLYGSFLENHDVERFPSFTQDKVRR